MEKRKWTAEEKLAIVLEELKEKIPRWVQEDYNKLYVHSQLGYMSPEEFEARYEEERIRKTA